MFGYSFFSPVARLTTATLPCTVRRWRRSRVASAFDGVVVEGDPQRHQVAIDGEPLERLLAGRLVVLLAHRDPRVGVHGVRPLDHDRRAIRHGDAATAEQQQPIQLGVIGPVAERARQVDLGAEQQAGLGEGAGDVVVVADPRHDPAVERPQHLLHGQGVGERLERVRAVGEHVDDGHGGDGNHPLEQLVGEHPGGDDGVVALEDPHDVLERLAHVDADLLATRVDRVSTELDDGHLHRLAGAVGRLLEDQRRAEALERPAELVRRAGRQIEDGAQLRRR